MTGAHRRDDPPDCATATVGAVDPHRPVVDGRDRTPKQLRADAENLRVELGDPAERIDAAVRDDGPPAGRERSARLVPIAVGVGVVALLVARRRRSKGRTT